MESHIHTSYMSLGVMHEKMNFIIIIFDRLNFSKSKVQCVRIKSPKYF